MIEHVAAGSDVYRCAYFVASSSQSFLIGASHTATTGVHHLLVFRTDLTSIPSSVNGTVDCFSDPSNPMQHMRGEIYGSQAPIGSQTFPEGVSLPLAAGEVLLLQVHLVDAGAKDIDTRVSLTLSFATSGLTTPAGAFFFDDPFVDVPAGASAAAAMRCLIPQDITLLTAASHDHATAVSFKAYVDPADGPPAPTPFYAALDAANPQPLAASVPVAANSRLRFTCQYQNVNGTQEYFEGLDQQKDEMCVLSGVYYPAMPAAAESCALEPDEFGTGTASCSATLACASACPAGSAPPADLGLSSTPDVDPCWQRCVVASCPASSAPFFALERCIQAKCSSACEVLGSDSCVSCQVGSCGAESSACTADPSCG